MAIDERDSTGRAIGLPVRRSSCVPSVAIEARLGGRNHHRQQNSARQMRVLSVATRIAAAVTLFFGVEQFVITTDEWWLGSMNLVSAVVFLLIPRLYRFGDLLPPVVFYVVAYAAITASSLYIGSGVGLHFYFLVAAAIAVLVLGIDHIALAALAAVLGASAVIALEWLVPHDTGQLPEWAFALGFVVNTVAAWVLVLATVWFALRETARAEAAMESEYRRSESLLTNILPVSVADRLKDPAHRIIADKYDDASILFADIGGYTKRASDTSPSELVRFLDALYTDLDALVDRHGLEKIKSSGDSYMVVSGVPEPRSDHLEALASLALDMAESVAGLIDEQGRAVPLRIGLARGPVVAGVVGARKFFYDVWGDAVNVASRMESTDVEGRIQVPDDVYRRLKGRFIFDERGEIDVKGKGLMRTWYLVGRRS